jgi:phosphocarrier protein HPr
MSERAGRVAPAGKASDRLALWHSIAGMDEQAKQTVEVVIKNPLGFHVRPIQRFVELSRAFRAEVTVEIEGRRASGKSIMGLMSLGGRHGSRMRITTEGSDARQASQLLEYLVESDFFVEDNLDTRQHPDRHIERLAKIASCFDSEIWVENGGRRVLASDADALRELGLTPTSEVVFQAEGEDGDQALQVMSKLAKNRFYVEEEMDGSSS